jgi:hypothetical protein
MTLPGDMRRSARYFWILGALNDENAANQKVALLREVDMSSALRLRSNLEPATGVKPSYTALIAKAAALALRIHPHANRIPIGLFKKRIVQLQDVDVSIAVERDEPGAEQLAFAATLRHTDRAALTVITEDLRALAEARPDTNQRLRQFQWILDHIPPWLAAVVLQAPLYSTSLWVQHRSGAVLVSSPAKYGADAVIGTWAWPLGISFGLVKDRPIAVGGRVEVRPTTTLTLSFDRRMMAGAPAARFFETLCHLVEHAEEELAASENPIPHDRERQTRWQGARFFAHPSTSPSAVGCAGAGHASRIQGGRCVPSES